MEHIIMLANSAGINVEFSTKTLKSGDELRALYICRLISAENALRTEYTGLGANPRKALIDAMSRLSFVEKEAQKEIDDDWRSDREDGAA